MYAYLYIRHWIGDPNLGFHHLPHVVAWDPGKGWLVYYMQMTVLGLVIYYIINIYIYVFWPKLVQYRYLVVTTLVCYDIFILQMHIYYMDTVWYVSENNDLLVLHDIISSTWEATMKNSHQLSSIPNCYAWNQAISWWTFPGFSWWFGWRFASRPFFLEKKWKKKNGQWLAWCVFSFSAMPWCKR